MNLRDDLLEASKKNFEAQIEKHRINIENMLNNSVGVGEHPDIISECDKLVAACSEAEGNIESLKRFVDSVKKTPNPIKTGNESSDNRK